MLLRYHLLPLQTRPPQITMAAPRTRSHELVHPTSPVQPPPDPNVLTDSQWRTLAAIFDATIAPMIQTSGGATANTHLLVSNLDYAAALGTLTDISVGVDNPNTLAKTYLAESATSCPDFKESVLRLFSDHVDASQRKSLLFLVNAMKY